MKKGQGPKMDEFAFVLLAGLILIIIMMVAFTTLSASNLQVSPDRIKSDVQINNSKSFALTLNGTATNVTLTSTGEIANWIFFDNNDFDVSGSETVNVVISVPSTAIQRLYSGNIIITFSEGQITVPVTINTTLVPVVVTSRTIDLGDFSISYSVGAETLASKQSSEAVRGYFANYPVNLGHEVLTDEKFNMVTGGFLSLIVDDTNSAGNLIIEFNGEVIFNQKVGPGGIDLQIDKSKILKSNSIVVSADLPGWMFWMNTVYKIRDLKFGINFQGISSKDLVFDIKPNEYDNLKYGVLTFRIRNYTTPLGDLTINMNEKKFFRGIPPLTFFSKTFTTNDILLNEGTNLLSFSTDPNTFYEIRDAAVTIYYTA